MRLRDLRFAKPMRHALIDLYNRTYSTDFRYDELELVSVSQLDATRTSTLILQPNTSCVFKFVPMGENPRAERAYLYRRITLSSFIPMTHRFMSETVTDDLLFLETMKTRFAVEVDSEYFSWTVSSDANGTRTYTLSALPNNPVWIGSVEILAIPDIQLIAIDLANEGLDPTEEEDPEEPETPPGEITNSILGGEFVFTQAVPSDAWYIEHNLDCHPTVTVLDEFNDDVVGSIIYLSKNVLQVVFSNPMRGTAILR